MKYTDSDLKAAKLIAPKANLAEQQRIATGLATAGAQKKDRTTLYLGWDRVECGFHAPLKGSDTWMRDRYRKLTAAKVEELRETFSLADGEALCEGCRYEQKKTATPAAVKKTRTHPVLGTDPTGGKFNPRKQSLYD